ncbi:hypothetical protein QQ045_014630 [Rhodiola kirilowii]
METAIHRRLKAIHDRLRFRSGDFNKSNCRRIHPRDFLWWKGYFKSTKHNREETAERNLQLKLTEASKK